MKTYVFYDSNRNKLVLDSYINDVSENYWCTHVFFIGVL